MKLKFIEFENFKNFKDSGKIEFSTDGKFTIIYGKNGDGKTTIHQLIRWVFYGKVNFNKTTSEHLYNNQIGEDANVGDVISVIGKVRFSHDDIEYELERVKKYKKDVSSINAINEDITLSKQDETYSWKNISKPEQYVESFLPSGLSDYFFFDGESMIADLRTKSKDSAKQLRKALYTIFGLNVLESAISHIGSTTAKTTVLGKLYLKKSEDSNDSELNRHNANFKQIQKEIEVAERAIENLREDDVKYRNLLNELSERIGSTKPRAYYEKKRIDLIKQRDMFLKNSEEALKRFGDNASELIPKLLTAKVINNAKSKIELEVASNKLPNGLEKQLVQYLIHDDTAECVCGQTLSKKEKEYITKYLQMLPPLSYTSIYNNFNNTAKLWGAEFDDTKLEREIKLVIENEESAKRCDEDVQELDNQEKTSDEIENLINKRAETEKFYSECNERLRNYSTDLDRQQDRLKKCMKRIDELNAKLDNNKAIDEKIDIMEKVLSKFKERLNTLSNEYRSNLENNIQQLIDAMLKSLRSVNVSESFSVSVVDNHNDEAKSEGQFAVVSFAYIGGILKMLQSKEEMLSKEYPLVLDGPFSKLDTEHRENVINTLPTFATQVIIFSKDDLHDIIDNDDIGKVWTLESNEEKNIAIAKDGHLWR